MILNMEQAHFSTQIFDKNLIFQKITLKKLNYSHKSETEL